MFKPGKLREEVLLSIAARLAKSSLAHSVWVVLFAVLARIMLNLSGMAAVIVWLAPLAVVVVKHRVLRYELFLIKETIEAQLGLCNRWDIVDDSLYLGSVPLEPSDSDMLIKKLGVTALLSFFDPDLQTASTAVGRAIQPSDWKFFDLQQLVIPVPDTSVKLSLDRLQQSADYLNTSLSAGHKVYVHCRSGKRQGALAVLAYFIKYKGLSAAESYRQLRTTRRLAFSSTASKEMGSLRQFEGSFRNRR